MTIFGYSRVSTQTQTTDNQKLEIEKSGYQIGYYFEDVGVSGKTIAKDRPEFKRLINQIRDGETVVCTKLDRLGRDCIDILQTVEYFSARNIKIIVLQLGNIDLTSSAGKLLLSCLGAVAEMERSLIVERTQMGLERAKSQGIKLGRRSKTTNSQKQEILNKLKEGVSVSALSREYSISRASVISIRKIEDSR